MWPASWRTDTFWFYYSVINLLLIEDAWCKVCNVWLLLFQNIVIRNAKIVWKHEAYCWHFCLNLKYLGWPYRACIKTAKNGDFCEEFLSENDLEAVLVIFCYYEHGAKAYEAIQKIATDQKRYRNCSLCDCNVLNSQIIPINQQWKMVGYKQRYIRRN